MDFYKLLIAGKDVDTGDYEYAPYVDRIILDHQKTQEIIQDLKNGKIPPETPHFIYAKYCICDEKSNEEAVEAAFHASNIFKRMSVAARFKIIRDIRQNLIRKEEDLCKLLIFEGHPEKLARWEILGMKAGLAEETLDFYKRQLRQEVGCVGNERLYWIRKADGVVCLEPPRNAPCSNSFTAVLTFLPGNTLIVKPPLRNPIATFFLWRHIVYPALMDNDAPIGSLNIVIGNSKYIFKQWLNNKNVNDIIYFGDSDRGLKIGNEIYQSGKKPILELSGNDILVVWKDADLDAAAESLCDAFIGSSQICMVPKIALIHGNIYKQFIVLVKEKISFIKAGLPSNPEASLTPVTRISEYYDFLNDAKNKGGNIIYGGRRLNHNNESDLNGIFIEPTLIEIKNDENALDMKCVREENFFPLLPMVCISSQRKTNATLADDEIFKKIVIFSQSNEYGLRFSLWIRSEKFLRKFIKFIDNAGLFRINSRHIGFSLYLATHGGTRKSGGPFGELNYFWQKTSHLQGISRTISKLTRRVI